jgi:hypothetical protein
MILDNAGHVIYRHDGLEGGVDEPLAQIRALLAAPKAAE